MAVRVGRARRKRAPRLEMTSLMDVMFLVLVFFIYAVMDMAVHKGVKVELPQAAGTLETGERLVVTVQETGTLQLNGRVLTEDELLARVGRLAAAGVKTPVLIAGARQSPLGVSVRLLERLKAAGVEKVDFQVTGRAAEARR